MANVQPEDGTTQIAHSIIENLIQQNLSGREWDIVMFILRKTYGFNKKTDWIANRQIADATGTSKGVVSQVISGLIDKKILLSKYTDKGKRVLGFNKDYDTWIVNTKLYSDNDRVYDLVDPIENNTTPCSKSYLHPIANAKTTNKTLTNDNTTNNIYTRLKEKWNEHNNKNDGYLIPCRSISDATKGNINARLNPRVKKDSYTEADLLKAIEGYALVMEWAAKGYTKIWTHSYPFKDFWMTKNDLDRWFKPDDFRDKTKRDPRQITVAPETEPKTESKPVRWSKPPPEGKPSKKQQAQWRAVLVAVREKIGTQEFNTWLRATIMSGYSTGEVWIKVPNEVYLEFITANYENAIKEAIKDIFKTKVIKIYFATGDDDLFRNGR